MEKSRSAKDAERAESKRLSKEEGAGDGPAVYTSKREARNRDGLHFLCYGHGHTRFVTLLQGDPSGGEPGLG